MRPLSPLDGPATGTISNRLAPVVVFGTGGSGTRVVVRIVGHAGCDMGGMIPQLPPGGALLVPEVLDFSPPSPDSVGTARAT